MFSIRLDHLGVLDQCIAWICHRSSSHVGRTPLELGRIFRLYIDCYHAQSIHLHQPLPGVRPRCLTSFSDRHKDLIKVGSLATTIVHPSTEE